MHRHEVPLLTLGTPATDWTSLSVHFLDLGWIWMIQTTPSAVGVGFSVWEGIQGYLGCRGRGGSGPAVDGFQRGGLGGLTLESQLPQVL